REDSSRVGARSRDGGGRLGARAVCLTRPSSGSCIRRAGNRRGARVVGRDGPRLAEARTCRVRGATHAAGARQFRAPPGRGAGGRRSPDVGGVSPPAPPPAPLVLVPSRAPLHVRAEREYVVGPLAFQAASNGTSPADLARVPAVR